MITLGIQITSMYSPGSQGGARVYASATIDGCFVVRGTKAVEDSKDGLFAFMPSRKNQDGYKEVCFPVTAESRKQLYSGVLNVYRQALAIAQAPAVPQQAAPEQEATSQQMAGM